MIRGEPVGLGVAWVLSLLVAVGLLGGTRQSLPTLAPVVRRVGPSVVSIAVGGEQPRDGSGFAIGPSEVVTARHLVAQAGQVTVRASDGRTWTATVLGTDARTDLALLAVPDATLRPAILGSGRDVAVGDWVLGLGNALGLGPTPVVGLVAQQGSRLAADAAGPRVEFWQLSLALNPGHSGAPIFDQRGRVVAVVSGAHAQGQAIAFAVPVEALDQVIDRLRDGEHISRAYLGLRAVASPDGVEVASVVPSSPADRAGVRPEDVLVSLDGAELASPDDLQRGLDRLSGGARAALRFRHRGAPVEVSVELTDWARQPVVVAGMTLAPAPDTGAQVVALRAGSRAASAQLRTGDVVRAIDGLPVQAPATIRDRLAGGAGAQLQVVRDGRPMRLTIGGRARSAPPPAQH